MAWNWGPYKAKRRKSRSVRDFHTAKKEGILMFLSIWKAQSRNCLARFEPAEDNVEASRLRTPRMLAWDSSLVTRKGQ